uniref:coiled-coil-helix-coiled-coil-helix domain-containing protein 10, mitochondrial-like isoform X2 n=1 Tax=Vespula vulgaris TaxID=7454 RepID=UPI00223B9106|nr:coiled-coil-helix-coiled-coil-helix domain-containing protein 10, mitochondrial-like isoform X2 [Vespula vulgaris]
MPGRQKTGTKNGKMGRSRPSSPSGAHPPPSRQQRGPDIIIVQSRKQPGMFGHIAGTAAGVAAVNMNEFRIYQTIKIIIQKIFFYQGTVIGDKISGRNEPAASDESIPVDPANPCRYEEEQVLDCMQNQTNLQTCEVHKKALLDCKHKHNIR